MSTLTCIKKGNSLDRALSAREILQSVFAALNRRNASKAVDQFAHDFVFHDYGLDLEFTDKERLFEFFQKSYELFPNTAVELLSTFECEDYAIAEWKLTGTHTESVGSLTYRFPIALQGSTIVQTMNGKVLGWSDYYDQLKSRRGRLRAFFEDWIES
jgi:SnoaL-like polyketide cyclase